MVLDVDQADTQGSYASCVDGRRRGHTLYMTIRDVQLVQRYLECKLLW